MIDWLVGGEKVSIVAAPSLQLGTVVAASAHLCGWKRLSIGDCVVFRNRKGIE